MRRTVLSFFFAFAAACAPRPGPEDAGDGGQDAVDAGDGGGDAAADVDAGPDGDAGECEQDAAPPPAPSGTKLFEGAIDQVSVSPAGTEVAVVTGDGALKVRAIADSPAAAVDIAAGVNGDVPVEWSGDGAFLLYDKGTLKSPQPFVAGSDGSTPTQVLPPSPDTGTARTSGWAPEGGSNLVFTTASATVGLRNVYYGPAVGPWTKVAENIKAPIIYSSDLQVLLVSDNCTAGPAAETFRCDLRRVDLDTGQAHAILTDKSVFRSGAHYPMLNSTGTHALYTALLADPDHEELRLVPTGGTASDARLVVTGDPADPDADPDPLPRVGLGWFNRYQNRFVWFQGPEFDDLYGLEVTEGTLAPVLLAPWEPTAVWQDCRALGDDGNAGFTHLSFTTAMDEEDHGKEWLLKWEDPVTVRVTIATSAKKCTLAQSPDRKWYAVVDGPGVGGLTTGALKVGRLADLADATPTTTLATVVYENDFEFALDSGHLAFIAENSEPKGTQGTGKLYAPALPASGAVTVPGAGSAIAEKVFTFAFIGAGRLVYLASPDCAIPPFYKLYRDALAESGPSDLIYARTRPERFWIAGTRLLVAVDVGPDKGLWLASEP